MKRAIRVHKENLTAIRDVLELAQGKATERFVTAEKVLSLALESENRLHRLGLPKTSRVGVMLSYYEADLPNAHTGRAETTKITMSREATHWYLSNAERIQIYVGNQSSNDLIIPQNYKNKVILEFQKKNDFTFNIGL